jgi:predicted dehydrogenase
MPFETIRIAIVGAGRNTVERHIPGLLAQEDVQITGVCNRSRESSQRVADRFEIPNVFDDWRQLVEAGNSDAVVVGTWPYLHMPVSVAALQAGKHVLCEARMAMNLAEARQMYAAARERPHLVAQLVPAPATLEVDATVRRLLANDYLGDLLAIEVRQQRGFVDRDAPLHWREDSYLSGLNVMSLGIWYEIVMRWVGEATEVMAMGQTVVKTRVEEESGRRRAIQIPDYLVVSAAMACGAQATFLISNVTGNAPQNGITLYGSKATLQFADGALCGGGRSDGGLQPITIPAEERGGWRVEEAFINAIRGTEDVELTTFADGVKYMAFTEAVARSLADRCAVPLSVLGTAL